MELLLGFVLSTIVASHKSSKFISKPVKSDSISLVVGTMLIHELSNQDIFLKKVERGLMMLDYEIFKCIYNMIYWVIRVSSIKILN